MHIRSLLIIACAVVIPAALISEQIESKESVVSPESHLGNDSDGQTSDAHTEVHQMGTQDAIDTKFSDKIGDVAERPTTGMESLVEEAMKSSPCSQLPTSHRLYFTPNEWKTFCQVYFSDELLLRTSPNEFSIHPINVFLKSTRY